MKNSTTVYCNHCHNEVSSKDNKCSHCGIPFPPNFAVASRNKFIYWFIAIVILCVFMMFWLPPNWDRLIG